MVVDFRRNLEEVEFLDCVSQELRKSGIFRNSLKNFERWRIWVRRLVACDNISINMAKNYKEVEFFEPQ